MVDTLSKEPIVREPVSVVRLGRTPSFRPVLAKSAGCESALDPQSDRLGLGLAKLYAHRSPTAAIFLSQRFTHAAHLQTHPKLRPSVAVLIPRTRTIGVRLSEDEYSSLANFCLETGARSISDLARTAICGFVSRASQESLLAATVSEIVAHVEDLQGKLEEVSAEIASIRTNALPGAASK
ncbi:MAG: hypothetical protein ACLGP3_01680 [Acidobacteriota bacterium]